jgi:putative tryptophan/tyrosine transport system substrate-binding protein
MDRRHFLLTSLAGALAAPLAAGAQQTGKVYRIGFLSLIPGENTTLMKAVQERLQKLGCIEGKNLIFDCRSAEGRQERLAELSTGLALARPDVLIAGPALSGSSSMMLAARRCHGPGPLRWKSIALGPVRWTGVRRLPVKKSDN